MRNFHQFTYFFSQRGYRSVGGVLGEQSNRARNCVSSHLHFLAERACSILVVSYSYAFDVDAKTQAFHNRRVFTYVDTGVADGVQLDNKGNLYAGTGDGVHVSDIHASIIIELISNGPSMHTGLGPSRHATWQILHR